MTFNANTLENPNYNLGRLDPKALMADRLTNVPDVSAQVAQYLQTFHHSTKPGAVAAKQHLYVLFLDPQKPANANASSPDGFLVMPNATSKMKSSASATLSQPGIPTETPSIAASTTPAMQTYLPPGPALREFSAQVVLPTPSLEALAIQGGVDPYLNNVNKDETVRKLMDKGYKPDDAIGTAQSNDAPKDQVTDAPTKEAHHHKKKNPLLGDAMHAAGAMIPGMGGPKPSGLV
jgi:hypothetical protein